MSDLANSSIQMPPSAGGAAAAFIASAGNGAAKSSASVSDGMNAGSGGETNAFSSLLAMMRQEAENSVPAAPFTSGKARVTDAPAEEERKFAQTKSSQSDPSGEAVLFAMIAGQFQNPAQDMKHPATSDGEGEKGAQVPQASGPQASGPQASGPQASGPAEQYEAQEIPLLSKEQAHPLQTVPVTALGGELTQIGATDPNKGEESAGGETKDSSSSVRLFKRVFRNPERLQDDLPERIYVTDEHPEGIAWGPNGPVVKDTDANNVLAEGQQGSLAKDALNKASSGKTSSALSGHESVASFDAQRKAQDAASEKNPGEKSLEKDGKDFLAAASGKGHAAEVIVPSDRSAQGEDEISSRPDGSRSPDASGGITAMERNAGRAESTGRKNSPMAPATGKPVAAQPEQVALRVMKAVRAGNTQFEMRIDPPDMGRVEVKLSFDKDGLLRARFAADRPDTVAMMQRDAAALQRALHDMGLKLAEGGIEFSQRPGSREQDSGQNQGRDQGQAQNQGQDQGSGQGQRQNHEQRQGVFQQQAALANGFSQPEGGQHEAGQNGNMNAAPLEDGGHPDAGHERQTGESGVVTVSDRLLDIAV